MEKEYLKEIAGHKVEKTVYLECGWNPSHPKMTVMDPLGEVEFFQRIAEKNRRPVELCAGIIGHADLMDENVEQLLRAYSKIPNCKGVRDSAFRHDSGEVHNSTSYADKLSHPSFRRGFAYLSKYGLTYELWLNHEQLEELADLAKAFPKTQIICDHVANPLGVGPFKGKSEEVLAKWKKGVKTLSQCPNVAMKLSGLTMACTVVGDKLWQSAKPPTSDELASMTAPYYLYCIECFGVNRCIFASNFPVDRIGCSYAVLFNSFKKIVKDFSREDKIKMFYGNAARVYRLSNSKY